MLDFMGFGPFSRFLHSDCRRSWSLFVFAFLLFFSSFFWEGCATFQFNLLKMADPIQF